MFIYLQASLSPSPVPPSLYTVHDTLHESAYSHCLQSHRYHNLGYTVATIVKLSATFEYVKYWVRPTALHTPSHTLIYYNEQGIEYNLTVIQHMLVNTFKRCWHKAKNKINKTLNADI